MEEYKRQRDDYLSRNDVATMTVGLKTQLAQKLFVFDELIGELIAWKTEKNRQTDADVLKDLSFIPLMKCLYIVCLLSVHKDKNGSLFDVFNNYAAYRYGPVDEDCYYHIDDLPHYKMDYENGIITKRTASAPTLLGIPVTGIAASVAAASAQLTNAVNDLKGALYFPGFKDKYGLVELTHRDLWEAAKEAGSPLNTGNMELLLKEARDVRIVIAA